MNLAVDAVHPARTPRRATIADAMRTWFAGDFEKTLTVCDAISHPAPWLRAKIAFLRARCYLRLSRPQDAHDAVMAAFVTYEGLDERCTAEMLLGGAEVRLGNVQAGLERLELAADIAKTYDAHPAVRSEIALQRGLGLYAVRDFDASDAALRNVDPSTDIIYAKSLADRAWVASARSDFDQAKTLFLTALSHLDRCRHRDAALEANILQALSHLAAERLDWETWHVVEHRANRLDWASGMVAAQFWVAANGALVFEAQGRTLMAYESAERAESLAPTPALRVHALCRRAAIARLTGEGFAQVTFVEQARRLMASLDHATLQGDELAIPLILAEELALAGRAGAAGAILSMRATLRPIDPMLAASVDQRHVAHEELVTATVAFADAAERRRDSRLIRRAHDLFSVAFRRYRNAGCSLRAAQAAIGVAETGGSTAMYEVAERMTQPMSEQSGFRRSLGMYARVHRDGVAQALTTTERDVLGLVLKAYTNREIAEERGVAVQTIKNTVSAVLSKYEVRTREQLFAKLRRTVGPAR